MTNTTDTQIAPPFMVREALEFAKAVRVEGNSVIITTDAGYEVYGEESVNQVDTRLFAAIKYASEYFIISHHHVIRRTLAHWENPGFPLDTDTNVCVRDILEIYESRNTPGSFTIRVNAYELAELAFGNTIATWFKPNVAFSVESAWLDKYYPGLTDKIRMLQKMELSEDEISVLAVESIGIKSVEKSNTALPTNIVDLTA